MASPKDMLEILSPGEPKAEEQLATVQIDALNYVCSQFADSDKKCLKRKVAELQHSIRYNKKWSRKMKIKIETESTTENSEVQDVLEEGKETGLTLSAEEVQNLCVHLDNARDSLEDLNDDSW